MFRRLFLGLVIFFSLTMQSYAGELFDAFLFCDARFGYQSYLKTVQQNWHYDSGTILGVKIKIPLLNGDLPLTLSEAIVVDSRVSGTSYGIGFGVVGQRFEVKAEVISKDEFIALGVKYRCMSWFVKDQDHYGAAYLINDEHSVHQLFVTADLKVF